ncbi:NAD(P)-dependent oxidoreductase [Halobacteria archaeon AArc-m2/3/4]|uniref:NAD(P)-dependent oxidoreductase n=1 Tax=Natronoglomus mannanivorans TaxID=2979990 RepID=A0ABT2QKK3_9EURY|nr:NAD(P)-dependent oxidoreductase [Halobacteria archaeon AArc-m2/3/4]
MVTLVTGALGGIGSWITDRLAARGDRVIAVDTELPNGWRTNVTFRAADLTNQGETWDVILEEEPDTVLHFAGVRSGRIARNRLFDVNVQTTHNVLTAAGEVGADVVWASSERAYGFPNQRIVMPAYLPIDEEHPRRPVSSYGGSKTVGEDIAGMIARRYDIGIASMRVTWVRFPGEYDPNPVDPSEVTFETASSNFWSYVDVRDVLSFIDAYLKSDVDGHEAFNVSALDNHAGAPTATLIERALGDVPERCDIEGEESVYSIEKAARLLDWEPEHDWRTGATEDPDRPSFLE